jgi:hypothetical protein
MSILGLSNCKLQMSKSTNIIFYIVLFFQVAALPQNTIDVSGHFSGLHKGQRVTYYLPFDGYSNMFLSKSVFAKDSTGFLKSEII